MLPYLTLAAHAADFMEETNKYYTGFIDNKYAFNMVLSSDGQACVGSYYYIEHKRPIFLYGNCSNSTFELQEQKLQPGYVSGVGFKESGSHNLIKGETIGKQMLGSWRSSDGRRSYPFKAHQVQPNKNDALKYATGTYELSSISEFCCANSMMDYTNEKGIWSVSASSNHGGQRGLDNVQMSGNDRKLLSSFKLTMDASFEVEIFSGKKLIADFKPSPNTTFLVNNIKRQEDKENNIDRIYKYDGVDTFIGNVVHISTTDNFDLLPYIPIGLQENSSRHAISLDYDPISMDFEIGIISEQCCDHATLYLKRL